MMPRGPSSLVTEQQPSREAPSVRVMPPTGYFHQPIIVLGGAILFVLVLVGLFIFAVYCATHWTTFVQQTVLLVNAAFVFVGILSGCLVLAMLGLMIGRALSHRETLKERETHRRLTEQLPSLPENVFAMQQGSPYLFLPISQDSYRYNIRLQQPEASTPALPAPAPLTLPGPCDLYTVMRTWDLSPENLFLALGPGGEEHSCTLDHFMHVLHDAPTGGGKTVQWFAELVQLLLLDVEVILANPHFCPIDEKGRDWRPIGKAIENQGEGRLLTGYAEIAAMLEQLSERELDRRYGLRRQGLFLYKPLYLFLDELGAVVERFPQVPGYLTDILRRGRTVLVNVDTNNQGFLNKDIELKGSAVYNFNTAFHLGGNPYSASKVLETPLRDINALLKAEVIPSRGLGQGIALLRQVSTCPQASLVRLPFPAPDYAVRMLGEASEWKMREPSGNLPRFTFTEQGHVERRTDGKRESDVRGMESGETCGEGSHAANVSVTEPVKVAPVIAEIERAAILACAKTQLECTGDARVNKTKLIEVLREMDGPKWNNKSREKIRMVLDEAAIAH